MFIQITIVENVKKIDLDKIFGSKCRKKILEKFFLEYESGNFDGFYMRELSRDLDEQINSIKRELDNLSSLWILKSKLVSKKKIFTINKNFFLVDEFKSIFLKNFDPFPDLKKYFRWKKQLQLVMINDSLQNRLNEWSNNVVDILIIGEIDKLEFSSMLAQIFFDRKIKYATLTKDDFYKRLEFNDKLIFDILNQDWNLFITDEFGVDEILHGNN